MPTVRWLCKKHGCRADFYTSEHCRPLRRLLEYQSCIDRFIIPEGYVIQGGVPGIQPWEMPVLEGYRAVYQLGYRDMPQIPLPDYIAKQAGAPVGLRIQYECPDLLPPLADYWLMAWRAASSIEGCLTEFGREVPCVQIGSRGEALDGIGVDYTGLDLLETAALFKHAKGFIGLNSALSVLAHGFGLPKIILGWEPDMPRIRRTPRSYFLRPDHPAILLRVVGI